MGLVKRRGIEGRSDLNDMVSGNAGRLEFDVHVGWRAPSAIPSKSGAAFLSAMSMFAGLFPSRISPRPARYHANRRLGSQSSLCSPLSQAVFCEASHLLLIPPPHALVLALPLSLLHCFSSRRPARSAVWTAAELGSTGSERRSVELGRLQKWCPFAKLGADGMDVGAARAPAFGRISEGAVASGLGADPPASLRPAT